MAYVPLAKPGEVSSGLTGLAASSTGLRPVCVSCVSPWKSPSPFCLCSSEKWRPFLPVGTVARVTDSVCEGTSPRWYSPCLEVSPTGAWGWGSNHLRSMTRNGRVVGVLAGGGRGREEADPCWPLMPVGPVHSLAQLAFPRTPRGKPCSPLTRRGAGPSPPPSHWAAPNRLRRGGSFRV